MKSAKQTTKQTKNNKRMKRTNMQKTDPKRNKHPRGQKTCKTANQKHNKTNEVENKTKGSHLAPKAVKQC